MPQKGKTGALLALALSLFGRAFGQAAPGSREIPTA